MVARILDAAEQCIHRFGIRRTAMGEVARVGKLSRGSIYRHFGTRSPWWRAFSGGARSCSSTARRRSWRKSHPGGQADPLGGAGRKDMREGIFASLAETEPETVAMMFLDPRFYQRSVSFWPPHMRMAQEAGEIRREWM